MDRLRENILRNKRLVFSLLILCFSLLVYPVIAGEVTITASGYQSYYLGEEIKFSGTNTESLTTCLFIIGPNLPVQGGQLDQPQTGVGTPGTTMITVNVQSDNSWSYNWGTSQLALDPGTYNIYALSKPVDKGSLSHVAYDTVPIVIKKPFIKASLIQNGYEFDITGSAEGCPSHGVQVWIIGENYADIKNVPLSQDCSFQLIIPPETTINLANGDYYFILQHPMINDQFDIVRSNINPDYVRNLQIGNSGGTDLFPLFGPKALKGYEGAIALVQAINDPNVDDTYTEISLTFKKPVAQITSSPSNPLQSTPIPASSRANSGDSPWTLLILAILALCILAGAAGYYVKRSRKTPEELLPALPTKEIPTLKPAEISNQFLYESKLQKLKKSQNDKNLIFISAKSEDFGSAEQVYNFLKEHRYNVFFSKQTLPDMGNCDYRREIDGALNNAKHMIVVTSKQEYVEASWVEAEWGLFINEKRSGRKLGNIITLIIGTMRIEDLPSSLRYYEVIPFDPKAFEKILKYLR